MNITFHEKSFRDECNDQKRLIKHHGALRAKRIRQRLDDLLAADTLEVMRSLPGRCHELTGDRQGELSLDLDHPWRLIFRPNDNPPSLKPDGGIDWKHVRTIEIIGIVDTHD